MLLLQKAKAFCRLVRSATVSFKESGTSHVNVAQQVDVGFAYINLSCVHWVRSAIETFLYEWSAEYIVTPYDWGIVADMAHEDGRSKRVI